MQLNMFIPEAFEGLSFRNRSAFVESRPLLLEAGEHLNANLERYGPLSITRAANILAMSYDELVGIITSELQWGKFDQYTGKLLPSGIDIMRENLVDGWNSRNLRITRIGMKRIQEYLTKRVCG